MTYTAAAALCRARQWQRSLALLPKIPLTRLTPKHLGATLVALGAGAQWEEATFLLLQSSAADAGAVAAVLGACGEARRWEQCLQLLGEMQARRVESNLACYTVAVLSSGPRFIYLASRDLIKGCMSPTSTCTSSSFSSSRW